MPRKKRPLDREAGVVRDASLVVIACEDTHAVPQYFEPFRMKKVQVIVLPTEDGRSSPKDVLARLDRYKQETATELGDSFWLCIDTDHWIQSNHIANLTEVLRQCRQKNYEVAISRPCFELWLLLHFKEYASVEDVCCNDVVKELRQAVGEYNKSNTSRLKIEISQVHQALARAKAIDTNPDDILPTDPMTRAYRLVQVLLDRDSLRLIR